MMQEIPPSEENFPAAEPAPFVMPASVSQKRFWMLEQMSPGGTALNIPIALQLSGSLESEILARALQAMVDRHEILRTRFDLIDGEPRQVIAPKAVLHLHRVQAGNLPADQVGERTRQEMNREAECPLDFAHAPLLRATLVEFGPSENLLMLTAHHIISDGWSNGLLVRELAAFYDAFRYDKPVDLSPLPIQYADYVVWQEEWLKTPDFQKQLAYWKETLEGDLPALDFPTDFPRQPGPATGAVLESLLLPPALTEALKRFCEEQGVTLFMLFFTAYFALLHRYTGQNRLMIGTTAAHRNKPELEGLIGLFANILVLLLEVEGEMTFRELLLRQRDRSLSSFAHHEVPFEMVLEQLPQRKEGRLALQTHFLFQRAFMQPARCGDLTISPLHSVSPGSTFELTFGIVERKEGIRLQMEYRTSLFARSTIQRLLLHFQGLLESAVADPETALEDLSLLVGSEREELEALLLPAKAVPATLDSAAILADLDDQLEKNFREGNSCFTGPVQLPPGAFLLALDRQLRLLPKGIPGDLYLGHPGVEAQSGFETVSGPTDATAPQPLLKTGFLGRNGENGGAELWGRADDFVRVQGFRCNLRAVEVQLGLHPAVVEAAVAIHPQPLAATRVTGYVVLKSGANVTGDEVRAFLKGKVSDLILPSAVVVVASLPKDAHGKILPDQLLPPGTAPTASSPNSASLQALLHQQLSEVWQRILQTTDLTIDDNFFESGGNSFLALRMMLEVEKLCGRPLPLSLLLTGATIADLARFIVETPPAGDAGTPIVTVQAGGERVPIFFLHGDWVGGGFYCHRLSRHLGDDQPFYALPPYHMREPAISSMEDMAAWHRAALQKQFPHGPYVVGGYCIGATVATELARQLQAEGETVSHLLLVDPPLWGGGWLRALWQVADRWGDARKWDLEKKIDFFDHSVVAFIRWLKKPLRAKLNTVFHRLGLKQPAAGTAGPKDDDFDEADVLEGLDYSTYFMSYRLHRPSLLSVPATLFFPETTSQARLSRLRLGSKFDRYTMEMIPGNHTTCITQHIAALAEKINSSIDRLPFLDLKGTSSLR